MALRRDCPAKTASSPEYPHAAWIVAGLQNAHHGFLALLGYDHKLDPAFLNVEDLSATSPCEKTISSLLNSRMIFPPPTLARNFWDQVEIFGIKYCRGMSAFIPAVGRLLFHSRRRRPK